MDLPSIAMAINVLIAIFNLQNQQLLMKSTINNQDLLVVATLRNNKRHLVVVRSYTIFHNIVWIVDLYWWPYSIKIHRHVVQIVAPCHFNILKH